MDSLLANYASSDDEDNSAPPPPPSNPAAKAYQQQQNDDVSSSSKRAGLFNSLPPPKSSSLFNSIPAPKSQSHPKNPNHKSSPGGEEENPKPKPSSTSLFSALPPPSSTGKKVVQFRPPSVITPKIGNVNDLDDDEDEDELDRKRKRSKESISTSSASSFLASVPAPRHSATLGALGSGRRSMLETEVRDDSNIANSDLEYFKDRSNEEVSTGYSGGLGVTSGSAAGNLTDHHGENYDYSSGLAVEGYADYGSYGAGSAGTEAGFTYDAGSTEGVDYSYVYGENVDYNNYNSGYGDYGNNAVYENTWAHTTTVPEASGAAESLVHVPGKRGRRDEPAQIIEVKQDELIKNRPREDQVKMTGIAFGPAYQPASSKGKPSKLHKRKHQIGSLFFDMKQKEMELAERRSKGFLTKSQTQAKYGW